MKLKNKERVEKILLGPAEHPFSMSRQLVRLITFCCVLVVCIQAVVMVAMMSHQYIEQEKEDALYLLENDHRNMEVAFLYVEDLIISLQNHTGLQQFWEGGSYDADFAEMELKSGANLFSERNYLGTEKVFVEKVYVFNSDGNSVTHLYYPVTLLEKEKDRKIYEKIYENFLESQSDFYYQTEKEQINLCMWLYDSAMNPLGVGILGLNRSFIEENYKNLEKFENYRWQICQEENQILGKEADRGPGSGKVLESFLDTGFGLTLYAAIPVRAVYQSLGNMLLILFLISAALILQLSFCGHKMARYYVKPLETIAEKIRLVGKGDFHIKLSGYRTEELQNISNTFNEMTDYMEHLVEEVYETRLIAQQAQIQYLQTQMNPHFLANVLSMIETKAAINGDTQVQQMIHQLSKLYQGKIFRKNEYFISLKEELEITEFYISLQKSRFGDKIAYSVVYEGESAEYERLSVPRLSIEPIVENAVCHGLLPKNKKGHINLRILKEDRNLKIYIEDDGTGFDPDSVVEKAEDKNHTHVGIWNTNKMIRNLCGEDYGIQIESKIGKGTTVCVVLPVKYGEKNVESNGCRR